MYIFRAFDRKLKEHILKCCNFFVKNCQDLKKRLNEITIIV